jgi:hypothetical protein
LWGQSLQQLIAPYKVTTLWPTVRSESLREPRHAHSSFAILIDGGAIVTRLRIGGCSPVDDIVVAE